MLTRISLIVAILAGLAVAGLNFVKVKEKITTLMAERDSEKEQKVAAQAESEKNKTDSAGPEVSPEILGLEVNRVGDAGIDPE